MPAFSDGHAWAECAIAHLHEHGATHITLTDADLADVLFFCWYGEPPTDALPAHEDHHPGCTDVRWQHLLHEGPQARFYEALTLLKAAYAALHTHVPAVV